MSYRDPKGLMRLTSRGREYEVRVEARASGPGIELELHRTDCKGGPVAWLSLEDAVLLERAIQAARDEAFRRAKEELRREKGDAELDQVLARVERALERTIERMRVR